LDNLEHMKQQNLIVYRELFLNESSSFEETSIEEYNDNSRQ